MGQAHSSLRTSQSHHPSIAAFPQPSELCDQDLHRPKVSWTIRTSTTVAVKECYRWNKKDLLKANRLKPVVLDLAVENKADMPEHFNQLEMNDERMRAWASAIGPNTVEVMERIFRGVQIKEQAYNSVLAVLRLSKQYSEERLEAACGLALKNASSPRYNYLRAILANNQDILLKEREVRPCLQDNASSANETGAFVRGAEYYGGKRND